MNDALDATDTGPQTDTLVEQIDTPRPAEVKVNDPRPSLDDTLKAEVEKAVKGDDKPGSKEKPEPDAKDKLAEDKGDEAKAKAEPKPDDDDDAEAKTDAPDDDTDAKEDDKPKPRASAHKEPPSGFDDAAKAEWEAVPESVRGAVHRRAQEMERGIQKYRKDAEEYEPIREFSEMAKKSGTDLATALNRYTELEKTLRSDPMSGLQAVVANLGLKNQDGSAVTLRDVAANIMGQSPDQAASRQEATINQLTQQLQEVTQKIGGFSKHVEGQQQQAKTTSAENDWKSFQQGNPRAVELEGPISEALQMQNPDAYSSTTERLRHAYAIAVNDNPSVAHTDPTPLAQTQTPPRQPNPAGQKSVSGAGGESRTVRKMSSDDAIKRSIAKLTG